MNKTILCKTGNLNSSLFTAKKHKQKELFKLKSFQNQTFLKFFSSVLLIFTILPFQFSDAQTIEVVSTQIIETTSDGGYFHPVLSPNTDFVLCTNYNYAGLRKISLTDKSITKLTDVPGAGYRVIISDDGTEVLHRQTQMINNRKFTSLKQISLGTGISRELIASTREQFTPSFSGNNPFFVKGNKMVRNYIPVAKLKPLIQIEDRKMVIYNGNNRIVLTPNGKTESYIWPSFSPDGTRIVYTVGGKGTFVCTADGKKVQSLGKLGAPKWLNNNILIGMDDKYFGQELISSEVIAVNIDGKNRQILAMDKAIYPAPSADGKKIAFSNDKGQLFIMNINIKAEE